jgi:hypothetical protein
VVVVPPTVEASDEPAENREVDMAGGVVRLASGNGGVEIAVTARTAAWLRRGFVWSIVAVLVLVLVATLVLEATA